MKTALLLLLCAFTVCVAEERINGENGWYVPTGSGFIWVDTKTGDSWLEKFENWLESLFGDEANPVNFYLLTPDNPTVYQPINMTVDSIKSSNYNPKYPVKFSVHGWRQSYLSPMNRNISDAWFTRGNYNLIVPDWPRARDNLYIASVAAVYGVGQKVATFIDFLNENFNLDFNQLELVGHSLGAHVVGMAGKNVQNGVVNTIVGLDAALPLFHYNEPTRRLASTDANYVQAIHTCANLLGFLLPIGTSDFYPNGGETQPGCGVDPLGICRHARSVDYYVAAVLYDNFESMKCANYQDAVKDSCISSIQSRMGAILEKYRVDGVYYVPVNSTFPYGILPE